jgi:SAM-dependent methyltransferase
VADGQAEQSDEPEQAHAVFRQVGADVAQRANRADWDRESDAYQSAHGEFLRDVGFVWSPEGLDEADAHLLGEVAGRRVLEIGCGAGQCSRWLASQGAHVVGVDVSFRQLQHSRRIDAETSLAVPVACATATALPVADEAVDLACSAFGALPFLIDIEAALAEIHRVLRPRGCFVFSVVHPVRRMLPDDPTDAGLTVVRSYFDRTPYVELDAHGEPSYVEPHHTLGDWVQAVVGSGLSVERLIEPRWPVGYTRTWGGWGPQRGALVPGTAIFVTRRRESA